MLFSIKKYIIGKFERRRDKKDIFMKIFYRMFSNVYKKIYQNYPDKKHLAEQYWGRKTGFEHAKDQIARSKQDWFSRNSEFYTLVKENLYEGIKILEIGCSAGQWPSRFELEKYNCNYLGIDINDQSIELAKKHCKSPRICFKTQHIGDFKNWSAFNLIISCQTLFFIDMKQINKMLKNMKKGSTIIISEPVNNDSEEYVESYLLHNTNKTNFGLSHNYQYILSNNNFSIIHQNKIKSKINRLSKKIIYAKKNNRLH